MGMQITYLGHAGFLVETERAMIVMDPWLSAQGAFDSAWFQLPCNHHMASFVRERLADSGKERYVYISHEHRDHFDPEFLRSLPTDGLQFIVPRFQRTALRAELARLHPGAVRSCVHGEQISIPGGHLKIYVDDSGINRDSAIMVKADGQSFLNLNDCKLYDEVLSIAGAEGPISVFACQFSGATWHPTCYAYSSDEYARISELKRKSKFEIVARMIEAIRPRAYIPSAGPACFLDPMLFHLNFEAVNIFPRSPELRRYLRERLPDFPVHVAEMMPGDALAAESGCCNLAGTERFDESNFEAYVRAYASRYAEYFADRPAHSPPEARKILEQLRIELQRKLANFSLHERIPVPLYFGLSDGDGHVLKVDFPAQTVDIVSTIPDSHHYSIKAPSWQIARVLDGSITWEELALTFRVKLNRKPDVYQTLIQGFLLMEPEDMHWFCEKFAGIERRQNRIIIEAGGTRYSIDRFCPHQGGDLSQGWLQEGRFWTCPRHRWRFALDKGGNCIGSNASIHAICLEGE